MMNLDVNYELSIIIPAYNAIKTIGTTLESIKIQNLPISFEVLIVNDCSDYDYSEMISKYKNHFNIREIKTDAHILNKILNIAIPISLGTSVSTAMSLIDSFLVPQGLLKAGFTSKEATILYAQLTGKASVIVNIPLTISMAICISVIPIIAEVFLLKRYEELQRKVNFIIKKPSVWKAFYISTSTNHLSFSKNK